MNSLPRILCIDDEPSVLSGLARSLRRQFQVVQAVGGVAGLEAIRTQGPFPVVMCDMRMPGLGGAEVLARVKTLSPDTVRVLLTGYAELDSAISAVNDANIFRFLTKPCATPNLVRALRAAVDQHTLITSERVLLQHTLVGCIKTLSEVLALSNPAAFGRATRARRWTSRLVHHMGDPVRWEVEAAALLSQIGAVTLPDAVVDKLYRGQPLGGDERVMAERLPSLSRELLGHIPRLEAVREVLRALGRRVDERPRPPDTALMLSMILDFDELETRLGTSDAVATLRGRAGRYDPDMLEAFVDMLGHESGRPVREKTLRELKPGMVLAEDMLAGSGVLLVARGQEITIGLMERVWNFARRMKVREPVRVYGAFHPKRRATQASKRPQPARQRPAERPIDRPSSAIRVKSRHTRDPTRALRLEVPRASEQRRWPEGRRKRAAGAGQRD